MPELITYPFSPIGSRDVLARMLHCTLEELTRTESKVDDLYRQVRKPKKDGTFRNCYDARYPLKSMQGRIECMILKKVIFPSYLMGGLADHQNPRDYVRNAQVHAGARVMVNEDIAGFFPSTSDRVVFDIWKYIFHFPADVARTLARLTTRAGQLPQGTKTSTYLANLVFWTQEPALVERLRAMGWEYTRYIDDMTVSSKADRTPEELGMAITLIASMVRRYGLRFKRKKHNIAYAGQRMEVTGLVVGKNSAGLGHIKRSSIRALVHRCETEAGTTSQDSKELRRAASLVGQYARLHPSKGQILKQRLKELRAERNGGMEPEARVELATPALQVRCSTN